MAYQGRKVWSAGDVLTASDMNSTVDQTVMVFDNATARTTAIPTPTEGMITYLKDTNVTAYYSGSAWVAIDSSSSITANRAAVSDGTGAIVASTTTATEIGYVSGVTSAIQTQLNSKAPLAQPIEAKTTTYTLVAGDKGDLLTGDGTFTVTIPASVFSAGDRVDFINIGTGTITFAAGSGLTLNSADAKVTITKQYGAATIFFRTATNAILVGNLA